MFKGLVSAGSEPKLVSARFCVKSCCRRISVILNHLMGIESEYRALRPLFSLREDQGLVC